MASEFISTVCPHDCPSACPLEVERLDSRTIGRVRGAKDNDYSHGVICAKVGRYAERVHSPERLTTPLVRSGPKGSGSFRPVSWDEALDTVAAAFLKAVDTHGPESVWPYYYAGTMGAVQRDGILRFQRELNYSAMGKTICSSTSKAGWQAGTGAGLGADPREIGESDLVIFWGCNALSTQIQTWNLAEKARKERGARIIVIDPYRNPTASKADWHIAPRPGTDGALACAVMHVCLKEGLADRAYMAQYTDCPDRLEAHLETRDPAWAAKITGLDEKTIRDFALEYGKTARSFIRIGLGMSRTRNGATNVHAVSCLPAVTGAWKNKGGGALLVTSDVCKIDRTLIDGLDLPPSKARTIDMCQIGRALAGDAKALQNGPPVAAMIVQNTNPAVVAPESALVREGLLREDLFLCVHEQFMTETAKLADVVLPATTFLEHDDFYPSYGQTFLQVGRKIIEPLGESRCNHDVLRGLAGRLGAKHAAYGMTSWEIIDETLRRSNLPGAAETVEKKWIDMAGSFEAMHFIDGFGHPDGKFRFAPEWIDTVGGCVAASAAGSADEKATVESTARMPSLPDHWAVTDESDAKRPFRLVTAPARNFLNTSFSNMPTSRKQEDAPSILIHPDDLNRLGAVDGARLRIGNDLGSLVLRAQSFDGLQPGVVVAETLWLNGDFEEGLGINLLVSADPVSPVGGATFHDTAVWIETP
ncbi:MAG: molybdopterin oxidoreductase family protein [Rhodospirillales bacterium]|nr:molybdopterin oxidoreductase family protein [Rhodospirillales bacterium]